MIVHGRCAWSPCRAASNQILCTLNVVYTTSLGLRGKQTELRARRGNVGSGTPMRPATETAVNNELAALFAKRQALT